MRYGRPRRSSLASTTASGARTLEDRVNILPLAFVTLPQLYPYKAVSNEE